MALAQLRIYRGPAGNELETTSPLAPTAKACISVPLDEILPVLEDAMETDRAWLEDFARDEVTISADLYEVIQAYQSFRPVA